MKLGEIVEGSFGFPCGTIPFSRPMKQRPKSTSVLPRWNWNQAIEYFKATPEWKREEWYPIDAFQKNQGGRGSCNYYMAGGLLERAIRKAFGFYIKLSPEYGYAQAVDGRDMGSLLSESYEHLQTIGLPPYLQRHYQKIRKRDFNREDAANAKYFLGFEWEYVSTWLECWIALVLGYPVGIALHAGRNYERIQNSGKYRGYCGVDNGRGNHAVLCDKPVLIGDIPGAEQPGSWGVNIHDDGIAYVHEGHVRQTIKYHQFYVVTGITINRREVESKFKSRIEYP